MLVTAACLFALFASIGHLPEELVVVFALGVVVTAAGAYLWLALSVRCPRCQRRIGWLVVAHMHTSEWLVQLWRGETCPACGDTGVPSGG
jgi:hypothetical protein